MDKQIPMYAYRYFLVPNEQMSIFQNQVKDKNNLIREVFQELQIRNKISKFVFGRKYILYFYDKLTDNIYICKFAKETHYTKHEEGDIDINNIEDLEYPPIYLIIDLHRQIILLEHKSSIFRTTTTAKNIFKEWLIINKDMFDYNLSIDEISYEHVFWDYVNNSEKIFDVVLKMKSPNLFDGWLDANDLLKLIKEWFNNTETQIELTNEKGNLKIEKKFFESFIKYITGGGGFWRIKTSIKGTISTYKSKENIKIISIPQDIIENAEKFVEVIKNKIDSVEDILVSKRKGNKKDNEEI